MIKKQYGYIRLNQILFKQLLNYNSLLGQNAVNDDSHRITTFGLRNFVNSKICRILGIAIVW